MSRWQLGRLTPSHHGVVRQLFWDTFALGDPIPFQLQHKAIYEDLALGWFLDNPEHSRVLWRNGEPAGYVLVCLDAGDFEAWQLKAAWRYLRRLLPGLIFSSMSAEERKFFRLRLLDGFEAWRDSDPMAVGAHAHFNVASGHRSGLAVRTLVEHIDLVCAGEGLSSWTGQINAGPRGRQAVLRRYGFRIESRIPNRTFSWLSGQAIHRLTVTREVGETRRLPAVS